LHNICFVTEIIYKTSIQSEHIPERKSGKKWVNSKHPFLEKWGKVRIVVDFTAEAPNVTSHNTWQTPVDCPTNFNALQE
jgi:hypothetical protein